jgi:hypothetical protein
MKKKQRPRPQNPGALGVTKCLKLSIDEAQELAPKILHFTKGNWSAYLRTAVLNYKPKKGDF